MKMFAAVLLGVLCSPRLCGATPVTFEFSGVLGDCPDPIGNCVNSWSGATFGGDFTLDSDVPTVTAFDLRFISGQDGWSWYAPQYPDPNPNDLFTPSFSLSSSPSGVVMQFRELYSGVDPEIDVVTLLFGSPLDAFDGGTFLGGSVRRSFAGPLLDFPFVSGSAHVVPEPSSVFLLVTGLIGQRVLRKRRRSVQPLTP